MRLGRAIALGAACVLALLVAGIWALPGMLDWTRYRASIAALAAAGIGRPVQIGGGVTLNLLPEPILTASGITVDDAGDGVALTARELRLRVALASLLAGRVDARELTLRGAELHLPWPPHAGALARRPPAWLNDLQARVEASRLQVGNLVLSDIEASVNTDPDTGTLSAAGTATVLSRAWRFTARLARPGGDGAAGLNASLDGMGKLQDTGASFTGVLAADGSLSGRVSGRGPDLSQLIPAPALAWRADGVLAAAGGLAVADQLGLEIGGAPGRGAVALRVEPEPRLDVSLSASRLDLDAWIPVLLRSAQPGAGPTLPTSIDLSAESASLAGAMVRDVGAAFDLDPAGGVAVRETTALLPGDAKLTVSGRLPGLPRGPLFDGLARLTAPDLRPVIAWLGRLAPSVVAPLPPGALRTADLGSRLTVDPAQVALADLQGTLNGGPVQGGLSLRLGPRLGVGAGLAFDRLTLDPWLPAADALLDPIALHGALTQALAHAGFDADLKLQIRAAAWQGARFGPASVDAQMEAGRLTIRRFEAALPGGIRIAAAGTLGEGGRLSEARLDASAPDPAPLLAWAPPAFAPAAGLLEGPANLVLQLAGPPDALAARAQLDLGDLRLEATPLLNLPARRGAGPVTVQHPGAPRLLAALGVPGAQAWLGDGSFSVIAQLAAAPRRLDLEGVDLVAGALRARGQLSFTPGAVSGRIAAESLPVPSPDLRSPIPLPVAALGRYRVNLHLEAATVLASLVPVVEDLSADVALGEGTLRATQVAARLAGGELSGSASLALTDVPRAELHAAAHGVAIGGKLWGGAIDLTAGTLDAQVAVHAAGHSPAALLATLGGTVAAQVRDGVSTGFDLSGAAAAFADPASADLPGTIRAALEAGRTGFAALDVLGTAQDGVLTLDAEEHSGSGVARLSGTLDLQASTLEGRLALQPGADLPQVSVRLTGPAGAPLRTPELAGLARWLAERS